MSNQDRNSTLASLLPTTIIELYEIDLGEQEGLFRFHPGAIGTSPIYFGGNAYYSVPIDASGFESRGDGRLPRPNILIANADGIITDILKQRADLVGSIFTRKRVYLKYIDSNNFPDSFNPFAIPNPDNRFEDDHFIINRKTDENKFFIQFELVSPLEYEDAKLPARIMIANYCPWVYRGHGCKYGKRVDFINQEINNNNVSNVRSESFFIGESSDPVDIIYNESIFNGTNSYGLVAHDPILNITDNFTVACWAKSDLSNILSSSDMLVTFGNVTGSASTWRFQITASEQLMFSVYKSNGSSSTLETSTSAVPNINEWNHYAATFKSGIVKLYVNGSLVASTSSGAHNLTLNTKTGPLILGGYYWSGVSFQQWDGSLRSIRIYEGDSGVLSEAEVATDMDSGDEIPTLIGQTVIASYLLATDVLDRSGNNLNATNNGILFTDDEVIGTTPGISGSNLGNLGLPVADDNDKPFFEEEGYNLTAATWRGDYDNSVNDYVKGDIVRIKSKFENLSKLNLSDSEEDLSNKPDSFYVCIKDVTSANLDPRYKLEFWRKDECSRKLIGCGLRYILYGEYSKGLPYGGFPSTQSYKF